jgi:hypothetical protein
MSVNLMGAHRQWAERPNDERFWNVPDMLRAVHATRTMSKEYSGIDAADITAIPLPVAGYDSPDLAITGQKNNKPVRLTHWSFSQLCRYADAPADYMRRLPANLAAECINNGMQQYKGEKTQMLFHRHPDTGVTLRALTTAYSRLWNDDVLRAITPVLDHGWMTPPARPVRDDPRARQATAADIVPGQDAFGLSVRVGDLIAPAGCYASDRDMFVFLVNPERTIDLDGDAMMRGVFLWNSEVGAGSFRVQAFYLEAVCGNHIVWNAKGVKNVRIVHKGNNFANFRYRLSGTLNTLRALPTVEETSMVAAAKRHVLGKDKPETIETVRKVINLPVSMCEIAYDTAVRFEHTAKAPPTSAWGFVHGLTRYSQTVPYADKRNDIDEAGGKLLGLAGKASRELVPVRG